MSDTVQQNAVPATSPAQDVSTAPSEAPRKRAIEEYFPIVEINRLAIPERNAFKPIYQMHKWFARRASCVFRAILLGASKPAGTDIMQEFYKDHTNDPDTNGKVILDPFIGGGTTVVEALRLGCKVIGIDLNPVAWFIVKTEVEPVDLDELRAAFERLANRKTASGLTVREELLSHYKTECPACGNSDADIIYVFWVKSAICTNPEHKNEQVPLFADYLIAPKTRSIRFFSDATCPNKSCGKTFDWEIEPAALVGEQRLMLTSARDGAGEGRGNRRWTYSPVDETAACPWCNLNIKPRTQASKPQRKKVRLAVFYCPHCGTVFQYRGTPPNEVECPGCFKPFEWEKGNVPGKGKFQCPRGHRDAIIESVRRLRDDQLLPLRMYALEGYCAKCAGDGEGDDEDSQGVLPEEIAPHHKRPASRRKPVGLLWKNNGKFFKSITPSDERRYQDACQRWEREKKSLAYPNQKIPVGEKTKSGLLSHHYHYWNQMFNPRQLLCLATLIDAIRRDEDSIAQEMMLTAFFATLQNYNLFCRYNNSPSKWTANIEEIFSRHDFQPKMMPAESNLWGSRFGRGHFTRSIDDVIEGKEFLRAPWDYVVAGPQRTIQTSSRLLKNSGIL